MQFEMGAGTAWGGSACRDHRGNARARRAASGGAGARVGMQCTRSGSSSRGDAVVGEQRVERSTHAPRPRPDRSPPVVRGSGLAGLQIDRPHAVGQPFALLEIGLDVTGADEGDATAARQPGRRAATAARRATDTPGGSVSRVMASLASAWRAGIGPARPKPERMSADLAARSSRPRQAPRARRSRRCH